MKIQLTNGMMVALIITLVYAKALGLTQGVMAREAGGDIWLSTMFATLQGVIVMMLTVWIIRRKPEMNFMEQAGFLFGKWAGKLVGGLIFVFFAGAFVTIMITFVYHIMDYFLPQAPTYLFFVVGLSVSLYGLYLGIEVIARTAFIGLLSMVIFNILMILGTLQQIDLQELRPIFQSGLLTTLWASRHNDTDWAMATLMVAILLPKVRDSKEWFRAAPTGIVLGGIIVVLWPILEISVLTPEVTAQYIVSCMQLARSAEIGIFMHRYEMIMVAMFIIPLFVQMMLCLYCAAQGASYGFGSEKLHYFHLPVALVLGGISYWVVADHMRAMEYLSEIWPWLSLPIAFGLPILLAGAGLLWHRKLSRG